MDTLDVLFHDATVIDGTGAKAVRMNVGVTGDRIAYVGPEDRPAKMRRNVSGRVLCPGFIDPHSHADLSLFRENQASLLEPLARQGITTFIGGNCGMAMAPIQGKNRNAIETYLEVFTQVDLDRDVAWKSMGEFFDFVEHRGLLLNAAILAPHGLLRLNETGLDMRLATDDEMKNMGAALDAALEEGAIGLSTGLQYVPGSQSDTRELLQLGKVLRKHDAIFTSHLRSYSDTLDQAIAEVAEVGEACGIRVQISHLFWVPDMGWAAPLLQGATRALARLSKWWNPPIPLDRPLEERLGQMMAARERGVDIRVDCMPTTTGFTHALAFFPPWALEGGRETVLHRMRDPEQRRRIRHSIEHGKMTWPHTGPDAWTLNLFRLMGWGCAHIMSVATDRNKRLEGMNLLQIARERGVHPFDAICDLLLEEDGHVLVFESMAQPGDAFTERSTYAGMKHPEAMISTDAILMGEGKASTLFYGCYPHFIARFVREKRMLSLEAAIRKITGLAAEHFRLKDRGVVREGAFADLVVFNPDTIASRATFDNPCQHPEGIDAVFINGHCVVEKGVFQPSPMPGRLLRRAN